MNDIVCSYLICQFLFTAVEITTATAVIRCNPPARGETTRPVTNQTMSTGSSFEYQCNVGYECIDCNMTATCLNTGNWSIPPPNCSSKNDLLLLCYMMLLNRLH